MSQDHIPVSGDLCSLLAADVKFVTDQLSKYIPAGTVKHVLIQGNGPSSRVEITCTHRGTSDNIDGLFLGLSVGLRHCTARTRVTSTAHQAPELVVILTPVRRSVPLWILLAVFVWACLIAVLACVYQHVNLDHLVGGVSRADGVVGRGLEGGFQPSRHAHAYGHHHHD